MSVYGVYFIIRYLQRHQSYKYIRFWAVILLLPVVDRCQNHLGTLCLTRVIENPRCAVEISTLSVIIPEILVLLV